MTTLERLVRDYFEHEGYYYTDEIIKESANYIEMKNAELGDDEPTYTVGRWATETKMNNPGYFISESRVFAKAVACLRKMHTVCVDETGEEPSLEDYLMELESETFKQETHGIVDKDNLINYLIVEVNV